MGHDHVRMSGVKKVVLEPLMPTLSLLSCVPLDTYLQFLIWVFLCISVVTGAFFHI